MHFTAFQLQRWTTQVFQRCGVCAADADVTARVLVRTSLRGIDTHGIARVPHYVRNLQQGTYRAGGRPFLADRHGTLHCDGDEALGQVVALHALDAALQRSRTQAIVSCTIARTGHLGALGVLALEAAERGHVALLCQVTPPIIGVPGIAGALIGNNPLAFAMPVAGEAPVVFDMAMSHVARGRVVEARRDGESSIPEGWAIDEHGEPTTDIDAAMRGAMVAVGGHKGLGLAMLVQCLAGDLTGTLQAEDTGPSSGSLGGFLLVANPELLVGRAAYDASVRHWLATYRRSGARYPGERQAQSEAARQRDGIPVAQSLLAQLRALGEELGAPLEPSR